MKAVGALAAAIALGWTLVAAPPPAGDGATDGGKPFLERYAQLWGKADYAKMRGELSGEAQEAWPLEKLAEALAEQRKVNGGVKAFEDIKKLRDDGYESEWSLTIKYLRSTAAPLKVRVTLVREGDGWKVKAGGLLPLDDDLFDK